MSLGKRDWSLEEYAPSDSSDHRACIEIGRLASRTPHRSSSLFEHYNYDTPIPPVGGSVNLESRNLPS